MVLAIISLGCANFGKDFPQWNMLAPKSSALYQAKPIRHTDLQVAMAMAGLCGHRNFLGRCQSKFMHIKY